MRPNRTQEPKAPAATGRNLTPGPEEQQSHAAVMSGVEAIQIYHAARTELDKFCEETDRRRAEVNGAHDAARQGVFAFINHSMIHEMTVFEVAPPIIEGTDKATEPPIYYLVDPIQGKIESVTYIRVDAAWQGE